MLVAGDGGAAATAGEHSFALPASVKLATPTPKDLGGKPSSPNCASSTPDGSLYVVDHEGK